MRLVCHIGTPKTASTFLQNSFAANAGWLQQQGVLYPDLLSRDANHITLFYAAQEGLHDFSRDHGLKSRADVLKFRGRLKDQLASQAAKAPDGTHTMLISSENLTGNLVRPQEIANLREIFGDLFSEIRIVAYLRRQDDALLSMYGEYMRRGFNNMRFTEFLQACMSPKSPAPYLYYRRLLGWWIDAFGKEALDVRLYDRARLAGGDILQDFMTILFETPLPGLQDLSRSPQDNTGLSAPALEFLRQMQPHLPNRKNGAVNPRRRQLQPRIDSLPASPRPRLYKKQSERIMAHFAPANAWLGRVFFPDADGPVFPDRDQDSDKGNIGKLSLEQFAAFSAHLLD
ncbi:hypothetical protein ACFMBG_21055 [Leisingera sp. D0M16]|uniref:hypothetical protein n=1 Tax=Leisingera coralii TaxID=3351347 RepID=UPI003B79795B